MGSQNACERVAGSIVPCYCFADDESWLGSLVAGSAWGQRNTERQRGLAVVGEVDEGIKEIAGYPIWAMVDSRGKRGWSSLQWRR